MGSDDKAMTPQKILIVYTDAGGGHKATALAIQAVLEQETDHTVDIMNPYKDLIADVDLFARLTPHTDEDVYNKFVLAKGWNNLFCLAYYAATLLNVRLGTRESAKRFTACWKEREYDLIISVMPMSNQGLYSSVKQIFGPGPTPFMVVITDFAETMKYTWFPKEKDYFLVCGNTETYQKALAKPHPPDRAFHTSGLIVHPKFYGGHPVDPAAEQSRLGLIPGLPTGCVMYGGGGSARMAQIALALARTFPNHTFPGQPASSQTGPKVQMIFLCGRNRALADQIRSMALPYPHIVRTFTDRVPYYLRLSDFLVGKPGPGTINEALVAGITPMVDARQALPQERYNLGWLKRHHKGLSFKTLKELVSLIEAFERKTPDRKTPAAAGGSQAPPPENRAVFELPAIVNQVLGTCHGHRAP